MTALAKTRAGSPAKTPMAMRPMDTPSDSRNTPRLIANAPSDLPTFRLFGAFDFSAGLYHSGRVLQSGVPGDQS